MESSLSYSIHEVLHLEFQGVWLANGWRGGLNEGMSERFWITGITGQDGSLMAEQMLDAGREVWGVVRQMETAQKKLQRWGLPVEKVHWVEVDLSEAAATARWIASLAPGDRVVHLAAQSDPRTVEQAPEQAVWMQESSEALADWATTAVGQNGRVLLAASSQIFCPGENSVFDESSAMEPVTAYGRIKAAVRQAAVAARARGGWVSCAILFNHESPRRPENFVTAKIAHGVARIAAGEQQTLTLGNLEARRDWSWAPDVVRGMQCCLEAERADDWVLASGTLFRVRDLVEHAFAEAGLDWRDHVQTDPALAATADPGAMRGNPAKMEADFGWKNTIDAPEIIRRMTRAALEQMRAR